MSKDFDDGLMFSCGRIRALQDAEFDDIEIGAGRDDRPYPEPFRVEVTATKPVLYEPRP